MKKEFVKNIETTGNEPGITVFYSQTSSAFMLITFLIGDLLFVNKSLSAPVNMNVYEEMNQKTFNDLKNKILKNQENGEITHLNLRESILMYMLVDASCKCFVDDMNETLKTLAIQNVKVTEEEYEKLRINFLRYGQSLVEKMNEKFQGNEIFKTALENLKK